MLERTFPVFERKFSEYQHAIQLVALLSPT